MKGWVPAAIIITGNLLCGTFGATAGQFYPFFSWSLFSGFASAQRVEYVAMVNVNNSPVSISSGNLVRNDTTQQEFVLNALIQRLGASPTTTNPVLPQVDAMILPAVDSFTLYRSVSDTIDEYMTGNRTLEFVVTFKK